MEGNAEVGCGGCGVLGGRLISAELGYRVGIGDRLREGSQPCAFLDCV